MNQHFEYFQTVITLTKLSITQFCFFFYDIANFSVFDFAFQPRNDVKIKKCPFFVGVFFQFDKTFLHFDEFLFDVTWINGVQFLQKADDFFLHFMQIIHFDQKLVGANQLVFQIEVFAGFIMCNQAQQTGKACQIFPNKQVFVVDDFFQIKNAFRVFFVTKINTGNLVIK